MRAKIELTNKELTRAIEMYFEQMSIQVPKGHVITVGGGFSTVTVTIGETADIPPANAE